MQPFDGTHFGDAAWEAYDNIEKIFQRKPWKTNRGLRELEDAFLFRSGPVRKFRGKRELVRKVFEAILNHRELAIEYGAHWHAEPLQLVIQPHKLLVARNSFYLLGFNAYVNDFRLYLIDRLKAVKATGEVFAPRSTREYEKKLKLSFGVSTEGVPVELRAVIAPGYAPYIQERIWHDSQQLRELDDGLELRMEVLDNRELVTWLRGFRDNIMELKPAALKEKVLGGPK